jgi:hypothetical protein
MVPIWKSRKFWLAVVGVVQVIVLDGFGLDPEIWQAIAGLIGVLIAGIALEDAGEKSAGN